MLALVTGAGPAEEGQGDRGDRPRIGQLLELGNPVGPLLAQVGSVG